MDRLDIVHRAIALIDQMLIKRWLPKADYKLLREAYEALEGRLDDAISDRDAWKRRAEAAEHDIEILVDKENTPCDVCEKYDNSCHTPASCPNNNYRNFKWRGPRDEGKEG